MPIRCCTSSVKELPYIAEQGTYLPLPEWAKFYTELGNEIAQFKNSKRRMVVAAAIPIRSYAAIFTALGIILSRANESTDTSHYFEYLCNLPKRTTLIYNNKNRKRKGFFLGAKNGEGQRYLVIQFESKKSGGLKEWIPEQRADQVLVGSEKKKLPKRQKGYQVNENIDFLNTLLKESEVYQFLRGCHLDCAIVGNFNRLKSEINETSLCKLNSLGTLQDILRVRSLSSNKQHYHTELFSDRTQPNLSEYSKPSITIFDGALGFLKWRDYFRDSHWIILLDRTENNFPEAVDLLNQDYMGRVSEEKLENLSSIPLGVETLVYQDRI